MATPAQRDGSAGWAVDTLSSLLPFVGPVTAAWVASSFYRRESEDIWRGLAIVGAATVCATVTKLVIDIRTMMSPPQFLDLTSTTEEKIDQEVRPLGDAYFHVLLFRWQILGLRNRLICNILEALNRGFDHWDTPFAELRQDPRTEVDCYCNRYGITLHSEDPAGWEWSKTPGEYVTLNEFFTRRFQSGPEIAASSVAAVASPATAVVTCFDSVAAMPKELKNDSFSIDAIGLPDPSIYHPHPCSVHYLSPSDYHCYHTPIEGEIVTCSLRIDGPYSMTVKPWVFGSINILVAF